MGMSSQQSEVYHALISFADKLIDREKDVVSLQGTGHAYIRYICDDAMREQKQEKKIRLPMQQGLQMK